MTDPAQGLFEALGSIGQRPPAPVPGQRYQLPDGRIVDEAGLAAWQTSQQPQPAPVPQPGSTPNQSGGAVGIVQFMPAAAPTAVPQPAFVQPPQPVAPQFVQPPQSPAAKPTTTRAPKAPKANSVSLILKCAENGRNIDDTKAFLALLATIEDAG